MKIYHEEKFFQKIKGEFKKCSEIIGNSFNPQQDSRVVIEFSLAATTREDKRYEWKVVRNFTEIIQSTRELIAYIKKPHLIHHAEYDKEKKDIIIAVIKIAER